MRGRLATVRSFELFQAMCRFLGSLQNWSRNSVEMAPHDAGKNSLRSAPIRFAWLFFYLPLWNPQPGRERLTARRAPATFRHSSRQSGISSWRWTCPFRSSCNLNPNPNPFNWQIYQQEVGLFELEQSEQEIIESRVWVLYSLERLFPEKFLGCFFPISTSATCSVTMVIVDTYIKALGPLVNLVKNRW